jgi:hypothetical protein
MDVRGNSASKAAVKRPLVLTLIGAVLAVASYLILPVVFEKWLYPPELESRSPLSTALLQGEGLLAPVNMWWETHPDETGQPRLDKSERILVAYGQAFIKGKQIPVRDIKAYLDGKVDRGEMEYVIVYAPKETRWKFLFPIVDQCRKSKVKIVLLDRHEV